MVPLRWKVGVALSGGTFNAGTTAGVVWNATGRGFAVWCPGPESNRYALSSFGF